MMRGPLLSLQARRGARVILDFCIDLGFTLLFSQHACACSKSLCVPWLFILVLLSHRYYVKVSFKPDISIYSSVGEGVKYTDVNTKTDGKEVAGLAFE